MEKSEIIFYLRKRREQLNSNRKSDGIRIDEINRLIQFIRNDVKKISTEELSAGGVLDMREALKDLINKRG